MPLNKPVTDIINQRYSCRSYVEKPIKEDARRSLEDFLAANQTGPLGTSARFSLTAATEDERQSLKGLGTYGFIKGATGFIIGAVKPGPKNLEDFGYLMEHAILHATGLGLGTCWLGGTFSKSRFAKKISLTTDEILPAVAAVGYPVPGSDSTDRIRKSVGAAHRLPWERIFPGIGDPGRYRLALEMLRRAPSASNKQPWRIARDGDDWHFHLARTKGYGKGSLIFRFLHLADLQRVDMGIAMCHFELTAREAGLKGKWISAPKNAGGNLEYVITWRSEG